ncbi:hypothetical protein LCGC14_1208970 [marine sediment metagenome]|uniref:Glutamine amidotransferase type-2 domain-containing protein n=1 Tax=marine sediment metagenome TaxID=412755 RepID=A0A0F9LEM2_9ZZZZ|nr:asparagine synthase (glutamine-hydrolyzing) [Candidatus Aminicenantes bacterium]
MCGICGIYNYSFDEKIDPALLLNMTSMLAHRGPDGEGVYHNNAKELGLGHRRLAIIDLESGNQPMSNEKSDIWVTFNGEIYNYMDIKNNLLEKGHVFKTNSDTEILIHSYEEYGENMLFHLNGIFAFAIWDEKAKRLFAARDHFGVKPFYYYEDGKRFVFASELKAILLCPFVSPKVDTNALDLCLTFRHTPSPHTLIAGIKKLAPGSWISVEKGKIVKRPYFSKKPEIVRGKNAHEWAEELWESYRLAVRRQIVSDVPIGLSLSGGVDSGTLLSLMSKEVTSSVNAFTVGFEHGEQVNEIEPARNLAQMFSAKFQSKLITQKDYVDLFRNYIWHLEEPIGNESALAYYFVAELAKGHVKVLLNGQGADESFAGYPRHLGERYHYLSQIFRPFSFFNFRNEALNRTLYSLPVRDCAERFFRIYSIITEEMKNSFYNFEMKNVKRNGNAREYIYDWANNKSVNGNGLEKMLYIDARTSLPDNLLLCEDKMSMACGIEARVPFLDINVMAIAESIPGSLKIRGLVQKYIHKRACEKSLPASIVYKKKIGFSNPMDLWMGSRLGDTLAEFIKKKDSLTRQYFNINVISSYIEIHKNKKADLKRLLFLLLSLEKWHRLFILRENS